MVLESGERPVVAFLDGLTRDEAAQFADAFLAILRFPRGEWKQRGEWFKPMHQVSNVWQVASDSHRILGFRDGECLILTNAFRKTHERKQRQAIQRCEQLRMQFKSERGWRR